MGTFANRQVILLPFPFSDLSASKLFTAHELLFQRVAGTLKPEPHATMPNINTGILGSVPVILPPPAILIAFEDVIAVTEEQRSQNASTAETLATLRDTLLPRLISGQLRLPEAQAELAEMA